MDELFESKVREHASLLSSAEPLELHMALSDLGIDSLATIQLLVDIEDSFDISFPDSLLTPETFESLGSLWGVVNGLIEAKVVAQGA